MVVLTAVESMPISKFKATCLAVLEEVRRTGRPVQVTRRGQPMAEIVPASHPSTASSWLGSAAGSGRITGDLVEPIAGEAEWEVLGGG